MQPMQRTMNILAAIVLLVISMWIFVSLAAARCWKEALYGRGALA